MEGRIEVVDGKTYKLYLKNGHWYYRATVEYPWDSFIHSVKKAKYLNPTWNFTDLARSLLQAFNANFGLRDKNIKDAGDLFEDRAVRHTQVAALRTTEELTQCRISTN